MCLSKPGKEVENETKPKVISTWVWKSTHNNDVRSITTGIQNKFTIFSQEKKYFYHCQVVLCCHEMGQTILSSELNVLVV